MSAWARVQTLKLGKSPLRFIGRAERMGPKPECISPLIERQRVRFARSSGSKCAAGLISFSEHSDFNAALDLHCREASRIIKEFSGGWYGKTLFQEGDISPDKASQFAHVAFKKLRAELRKRRGADA
jgi:hypothetical protein